MKKFHELIKRLTAPCRARSGHEMTREDDYLLIGPALFSGCSIVREAPALRVHDGPHGFGSTVLVTSAGTLISEVIESR